MPKQTTTMSRLTGQLEKCFRLLNEHFFGGALEMPVITVSPTKRAYGHYTLYDAWTSNGEGKREINIASATLDRPLEEVVATLLHECCHYYDDTVLHVRDCSKNGAYHSDRFYHTAVTHGLNCERVDNTYGYAKTSPADELLQFLLDHDEIREIELCRAKEPDFFPTFGVGVTPPAVPVKRTNNSRRWVCPSCGAIVRSTRPVNLICGDCLEHFVETV